MFLRRRLFLVVLAATAAIWLAKTVAAQPFQLQVIDSQTGRGVPLVEVTAGNGVQLITDSQGIVALDAPDLLDRTIHVGLRSYGYGEWGGTVQPQLGTSRQIAIDRINRAERLYRVTGEGIYAESVQAGLAAPIDHPLLNANVTGQDSVQTTIYRDKLHWIWGDTLYVNGGFNLRASGATSSLPASGGLDPSLGVNLNYFTAPGGNAKQMMPINETGLVWLDALATVKNLAGQDRMFAHYSRIVPQPSDQFHVAEHGLALFNDSTETFQRFQAYPADAPIVPRGHAFRHTVDGTEYIYFAEDYPNVRVKADWASVTDLSQWEAFTPLVEGTRYNAAAPPLEKDLGGNVVLAWKKNADPLSSQMLNELVQRGHFSREESPFRLEDYETGRDVYLHRASVAWNEYRRNWIMIGAEAFGDSFLGEVWFSEAPTPEGPWEDAVKVVTHNRPGNTDDYTFYNPKLHPYFDQEGGRFIYFEGTYANTFSGNDEQTPLYDYNQIMYRLDLSTIPQLTPLRGDYTLDGVVDGADFLAWQRQVGQGATPFSGADGNGDGVVDDADLEPWRLRFGMQPRGVAGPAALAAVPEPPIAVLTISTVFAIMLAQGRHVCIFHANMHPSRRRSITAVRAAEMDCQFPSHSPVPSWNCTSPEWR